MKKFISMVMAAAMVVSLVPATAFAAKSDHEVKATAKPVNAWEMTKDDTRLPNIDGSKVPEVQLKVTDVDYLRTTGDAPKAKVTLKLDNADFKASFNKGDVEVVDKDRNSVKGTASSSVTVTATYSTSEALVVDADLLKSVVNGASYYVVDTAKADQTGLTSNPKVDDFDKDFIDTALSTNTILSSDVDDIWAAFEANFEELTNVALPAGHSAKDYYDYDNTTGHEKFDLIANLNGAKNEVAVTATTMPDAFTVDWATLVTAVTGTLTAATQSVVKEIDSEVTAPTGTNKRITVTSATVTDDNEAEVEFEGWFEEGDVISINLPSVMDKTSEGRKAAVSVESKEITISNEGKDLVYAAILGHGISASVKKLANVAEEEVVTLEKDLVIKSNVGDFVKNQEFTIKTSKGFEFTDKTKAHLGADYTLTKEDDNEYTLRYTGNVATDEITVDAADIEIEATTAKAGATCTLTIKAVYDKDNKGTFNATTTVEVMKVVDYKVELTVDEDEDVPVIYSGVDVDNTGITDDSDHLSLEVTAEETFPGAWSFRKGFNFELPEGVYVTDVEVTDTDGILKTTSTADDTATVVGTDDVEKAFYNAYQDGDHLNFEFDKRVFDDVDSVLNKDCATMTFQLELVADPTFEGDVVLKLTGDLVDEQEVTIAKFVKPYTVKAEQNDMKIDYRYTDIPTTITITEAEAGLWDKDARFTFTVDDNDTDMILFEDGEFEVDKDSELELKKYDDVDKNGATFTVKSVSDEAATVTLKDMSLFMQRNIPAGPYDLTISSSLADAYEEQGIFAADEGTFANDACTGKHDDDKECFVGDVCDYSDVVKAAFVNVITSGRDKDDASFTTKVVVPVGESYIIAGENQVALDVPAYVSAAGYTMLPVRAVAVALGIDTQNVLWNQPTRTVTILYGQRIITMTAGQKVVYVNGSAIPASASVEITNGRTFLPMRDLATALGVTDITWDAATKTATLNGNQK